MNEKEYIKLLGEISRIKNDIKIVEKNLEELKTDIKNGKDLITMKKAIKSIKELELEKELLEISLDNLENEKIEVFEKLKKYYKTVTEISINKIQKERIIELKNFTDKWLSNTNTELKKVYEEVSGIEKTSNLLKGNCKDSIRLEIKIDYDDLEKKINSLLKKLKN